MIRKAGLAICLAAATAAAWPAAAQTTPVALTATPIAHFRPATAETSFGALDYIGGFAFRPSDRQLRGLSSLRFREPFGQSFLAVTDTGLWFAAQVRRDAAGVPTGLTGAIIAPILDRDGNALPRKGDADAEGLAIDGDKALVSFERDHRVETFDMIDPVPGAPVGQLDFHIPTRELRGNQGMETIAVSPAGSRLRGAAVVVTEQSIDERGNFFAAILGRAGGVFKIVRQPPWHVTDGAFLPDGDLVLLERRYEGLGRIGMRLRLIDGRSLSVGALVDGPVLMEADGSYEIDNMEALDIFVDRDGYTVFAIASDDNGSLFQRNLYLEFRYRAERMAGSSR